jgi:serine/threonine protein kinase
LHTRIGTTGYQAPEIIDRENLPPYRGESVDVFAIAVTLFVMYLRVYPFLEAKPNEENYKHIA